MSLILKHEFGKELDSLSLDDSILVEFWGIRYFVHNIVLWNLIAPYPANILQS